MMIEFIGKFYDNHSLTIINRNLAVRLSEKFDVYITPLDQFDPQFGISSEIVGELKKLEQKDLGDKAPDIQIRHCYPPVWNWPAHPKTKVIFIQPWEYPKAPFEWQYKFETFADALIVPSNYCKEVFTKGGLNPNNCFVVPNGFNNKIFNKDKSSIVSKFNIDPERFNFVYVGNSQWRKGLDILINVWHKAFKKYDKTTLIIKDNSSIYGKNNVLNEIIKMQYKTECAEVIYIDENISEEDMANIYKASNVLVHPYRAEGFGMHVQEAMACGCLPVVPVGGPTDDFIPDEIGLKLPIQKKNINITDPGVFATKPGDAMTLMSSHTFINEPSGQHLEQALKYIYHHHNKQDLYKRLDQIPLKNTWDSVTEMYEGVINEVQQREGTVRSRFG
jgi:glycosyltransferase involved in cell wall biosynthesis